MRLGSSSGGGGASRRAGSAEGLRMALSNQSRERHRIASRYFSSHDRPEWHNPCGGIFDPNGKSQPPNRDPDHELQLFKDVSGQYLVKFYF